MMRSINRFKFNRNLLFRDTNNYVNISFGKIICSNYNNFNNNKDFRKKQRTSNQFNTLFSQHSLINQIKMNYATNSSSNGEIKSFFKKICQNNVNSLNYKDIVSEIESFIKPFVNKVDGTSKVKLSNSFEEDLLSLSSNDKEILESILKFRVVLDHVQKFEALGEDLNALESSLISILKSTLTNDRLLVQPIDPMFTHPDILNQMIENEAVHPYTSHRQIFDRVRTGRLCLVLFSQQLPNLPLMSLYIALTEGIADNMNIINEKQIDLSKVDSAMFYSISSLHKGLKNVDLGHILISRATEYLQINPQIKNFCTLSPIPNFRNYLKRKSTQDDTIKHLLDNINSNTLNSYKETLESICLKYLFLEKKKNNKAMDPVCNFHLKNGASIYRLNWSGDHSDQRINESYGMMINYLYLPSLKSINSINYKQNGIITHQQPIQQLAKDLNIKI